MARVTIATLIALSVIGCGGGETRVLGSIYYQPIPPQQGDPLVTPDSVPIGQELPVLVYTGGDGCYRKGTAEVAVAGRTVDITPYDVRQDSDACTARLYIFEHRVGVQFDEPGDVTVVLHARDGASGEIVELVRTVVVFDPTTSIQE